MSWTNHFKKGAFFLKSSQLDESLKELNLALSVGGDREYIVYDSRAAVYEKQGKFKDALQDVRKVIRLAPTDWQGYARAARLFLRVGKLDEAITMAEMAIRRLDSKDLTRRTKLTELKEDVLARQRQRVYHFGKLPVEIVALIFGMVVSPNWSRVLLISSVCTHWRNVALNTPSLWSILVLTNQNPARHAQRWIERSKGRIREISLRSQLSNAPVNLDGLLWNHTRVCRTEGHHIADYVGGKSKIHLLSEIEELEVTDASRTQKCDVLLSVSDSNLRRLTLDGAPFTWQLLVHHRNLTSLIVRNHPPPPIDTLMAVLEANPMLEQLILDLDPSMVVPFPSSESSPLTLSHLHTLHLSTFDRPTHFFETATMPSLHTLHLARIRVLRLTPLNQRRPALTHLSLNCCLVSAPELLELLDITPTLKTLELVRLDSISNLVIETLATRSLQPTSDTPLEFTPLCPGLVHLNVSHCPDVQGGPLARLLRARNPEQPSDAAKPPVVAVIKSVLADGCPLIDASSISWFRARVKAFSCTYLTKKAASWKR
ncbi:hypothetical protein C8J57DRAFT_1115677 [Mycena rebaudengoi]|nr:hypothetical protein C8J57DRAFT_1115677 [Mycena rebaudengoi]